MQFTGSGTMPLRIKTGRWQGKGLEEKLCPFCNRGIIEDEFHFFFVNVKPTMYCVKICLSQLIIVTLVLKMWHLENSLSTFVYSKT